MPKASRLSRKDMSAGGSRRRINGTLFSVSFSPLSGGARCTCSVSKKVSPKATERNRIKRLCREALRKSSTGLASGAYVFSARREAREARLDEVVSDIRGLLSKLRSI